MRTPQQESGSLSQPTDLHPPQEPRLRCPPTPPPELLSTVDQAATSDAHKDNEGDDVPPVSADRMPVSGLAAIRSWNPYMTPDRDENNVSQHASGTVSLDLNQTVGLGINGGVELDRTRHEGCLFDRAAPELVDAATASGSVHTNAESCEKSVQTETIAEMAGDQNSPSNSSKESNSHISQPTSQSGSMAGTADPTELRGPCELGDITQASMKVSETPPFTLSTKRLYPYYPSSFLRPGSKFYGTQQSDNQVYKVDVQILTLSVPESSLTGYLRICGLTEDHPTLTTFFTGEIIGGPFHKYGFQTQHQSWGATELTDLQHWAQFHAWRQLNKTTRDDAHSELPGPKSTSFVSNVGRLCRRGSNSSNFHKRTEQMPKSALPVQPILPDYQYDTETNPGWWRQPHVFMRWKEWFLVPDHRVTTIPGASFEGFYYICFSQVDGNIHGVYFHGKSKK